MTLSVIIPNYNSSGTIIKTIDSFSDIKEKEIIVVDNASTDGSIGRIRELRPIAKIIALDKNYGASKARNAGIKGSKNDLLLFIDSDAWLKKGAARKMISLIDAKTDIVFPNAIFESGEKFYPTIPIEEEYPHISVCFIIKRDSLRRLDGIFDEAYETYLEDYDFFIRCRLAGLNAKYAENAVLVHANKTANDYSRRYFLETRNIVYGILKFWGYAGSSGMYNPFKISSVLKSFYCGVINFAWFDSQAYDRKSKKIIRKSKIQKLTIFNVIYFIRAIFSGLSMAGRAYRSKKKLRKFYNLD